MKLFSRVLLSICFYGLIALSFIVPINAFSEEMVSIEGKEYNLSLYNEALFLDDRYVIEFQDGGKFKVSQTQYVYYPNREYSINFIAIPYKYEDSIFGDKTVDVSFESICYVPFWGEDVGNIKKCSSYESYKEGRDVVVEIGEYGNLLKGVYKYEISYVVDNALIYKNTENDNKAELYWNVIGTGSEARTIYSDVLIKGYDGLEPLDVVCYVGASGVNEQACSAEIKTNGDVYVKLDRALGVYEGYTIAVAYPEGSFGDVLGGEPTVFEEVVGIIILFSGCCCPIPVFILMYLLWWFKGRDKKPSPVIPVYFVPEGFTPLLASFVDNMSTKEKDISATLIELAVKGYIRIEQLSKTQYRFHNIKKASNWGDLPIYEQEVLKGLFGWSITEKESVSNNELKERFYTTVSKVKRMVENDAVKTKKYFEGSPTLRSGLFIALGIVVGFIISLFASISLFYLLGGIVSGIIIIVFGIFMGKRNKAGEEAYRDVLGLKLYIDMAEEERIKFFNNPDKFEQIKVFEALLPYAMIFNLEKKWAKEFENIYSEPPNWYTGYNVTNFNTYYLASALNSFNNSMRSTTYASPRSEGSHVSSGGSGFSGGFSGGGFGGGSRGFR